MECPCVCDCGEPFDLHDGYRSERRDNVVICPSCHRIENKDIERVFEIRDIIDQIEEGNIPFAQGRKYLKELGVEGRFLKSKKTLAEHVSDYE
jgi:hypothetical protein